MYIFRLYAMGVRVDDTLPCVERDDLYREHPDIPVLPEFSHLPPIHITRNEVNNSLFSKLNSFHLAC